MKFKDIHLSGVGGDVREEYDWTVAVP